MKTSFELVKIVLDELYEECNDAYAESVDDEIKKSIEYLKKSYKELENTSSSAIDYKSPATRFAYVYKYVAAHADYLYQALTRVHKDENFKNVISQEALRVSAIGGGPGSDIIGLLKFILEQEIKTKITCYLCDKEQAWADSWTEINEHLPSANIILSTNFQPLDITQPNSWASQRKFLKADIFVLNYFVSEIIRFHSEAVQHFWETLFTSAKDGAYFLYVDNGYTNFSDYFDKQWKKYGLTLIAQKDLHRITPSYEEQSNALKTYIEKFSDYPKIQSQISYRLIIKNESLLKQ